jgi:hypothetical protein
MEELSVANLSFGRKHLENSFPQWEERGGLALPELLLVAFFILGNLLAILKGLKTFRPLRIIKCPEFIALTFE